MPEYRIRPCLLADLRVMAREMRDGDRSEIAGVACVPRHLLHSLWRSSVVTVAYDVDVGDGWRLAAIGGECGTLLESVGQVWLFTAPIVEKIPLAFFREVRKQVIERLFVRRKLMSGVRADYAASIRFFRMIGFTVGAPVPWPPYGIEYCDLSIGRD